MSFLAAWLEKLGEMVVEACRRLPWLCCLSEYASSTLSSLWESSRAAPIGGRGEPTGDSIATSTEHARLQATTRLDE